MYLRGMPHATAPREQTQVPMLIWLPPPRDATLGHDKLCPTVMRLLGVHSRLLNPALDPSATCHPESAAAAPGRPSLQPG